MIGIPVQRFEQDQDLTPWLNLPACTWFWGDPARILCLLDAGMGAWRRAAGPSGVHVVHNHMHDPPSWDRWQSGVGQADLWAPQTYHILHLDRVDPLPLEKLKTGCTQSPMIAQGWRWVVVSPAVPARLQARVRPEITDSGWLQVVEVPRLTPEAFRHWVVQQARRLSVALSRSDCQQLADTCQQQCDVAIGLLRYLREQPDLFPALLPDQVPWGTAETADAFGLPALVLQAYTQQSWGMVRQALQGLRANGVPINVVWWALQEEFRVARHVASGSAESPGEKPIPWATRKRATVWQQMVPLTQLAAWDRQLAMLDSFLKSAEPAWAWLALERWVQGLAWDRRWGVV